jgi:predicted dehydrogenase
MIAAHIATTDKAEGWRGDRVRSGGGVLLNGAYDMIDLFVSIVGVPQLVYTEIGRRASAAASHHDTEDFASVTLRFGRDRIGTLLASRGAPAHQRRLTLTTARVSIDIDQNLVLMAPSDGAEPRLISDTAIDPTRAVMDTLVTIRRGESRISFPPASDHLSTLAVIEAAYLSAKTGVPESPRQFLDQDTVPRP